MRIRLAYEYNKRMGAFMLLAMLVLALSGGLEFYRQTGELLQLDLMSRTFRMVTISITALLNALPALVALFVIGELTARFVHALYDTQDLDEARDIFQRNFFGMTGLALKPLMIVWEGHVAVGAGSTYDLVGGPGFLVVYNDSAVVLEQGGRLTRVVGPYLGLIERFERVWDVVDLRPQRWSMTVSAMTREGIPITCEADITFQIDDRYTDEDGNVRTIPPIETRARQVTDEMIEKELGLTGIAEPHPYMADTVFRAATSGWIRIRQRDHPEQLRKWTGRVMIGEVEGALRTILYDYWLDDLMQPSQSSLRHPREEIQEKLEQKLRDGLPVGNKLGARVLSVHLGKIDVDVGAGEDEEKKVSTQWIEAWQAMGERRAVESVAEGEAALARLQAAQVQAQAEMALALTEAIRPFSTSKEEISSYELAVRFVETLWWISYSPEKQAFLPPDAIRTLEEMKKLLREERGLLEEPPQEPSGGQQ